MDTGEGREEGDRRRWTREEVGGVGKSQLRKGRIGKVGTRAEGAGGGWTLLH